ncbi:hypothetical protein KBI23_02705 [bacterium]|nr:hypothetical protein [bacterium]MBP9808089.1 hypothetical protein [bacterium]
MPDSMPGVGYCLPLGQSAAPQLFKLATAQQDKLVITQRTSTLPTNKIAHITF